MRSLLRGPLELGRTSKVGRLEELNGHRGLTGRLWEADGTHWICAFKSEHIDVLPEAWLRTVTIIGEAKLVEEKRGGTFIVETILIHETSGERSLQGEEGVNGGAKRDHLGGVRRDRLAAAGLSP